MGQYYNMQKMKTTWYKGVTDDQIKEDIKSSFLGSTVMRKRLAEICEDKIKSSLTTAEVQYECPNWTYKQADNIGYRRAMKDIINLISSGTESKD